MLDRLVCRSVLADADRVVRKDPERGQAHDCRQPHRGPHVVGEDEKRRAERPQAGQAHAVDERGHAVLANAEVHVAAVVVSGLEVASTVHERIVEGAKSAAPPTSHGSRLAIWFRTLPDVARVATPFASAGNDSAISRPSRPAIFRPGSCRFFRQFGELFGVLAAKRFPLFRASGRGGHVRGESSREPRQAPGISRPPASRRLPW